MTNNPKDITPTEALNQLEFIVTRLCNWSDVSLTHIDEGLGYRACVERLYDVIDEREDDERPNVSERFKESLKQYRDGDTISFVEMLKRLEEDD